MKKIESELEHRCIRWARSQGWDCWKNEKNGNKGIPDHSLLRDECFILIEFKAFDDSRVSPLQKKWLERHRNAYLVNDFEHFKFIVGHHYDKFVGKFG